MSSCRNALEELVIEEAEAQFKRLGADVKKQVDLSEVIAYTLNRLPPMYATTQRGWTQQRKRAAQEMGTAITKTVRNGFLSTQSDVLRQADPIPNHELISQARSLAKLRKLFKKDYLKWKDVPNTVKEALELGTFQHSGDTSFMGSERRSSLLARSYVVRRQSSTALATSVSATKSFSTEQDISDFDSYMSGTTYRYSNILESLVTAIVERRLQRMDETIQKKIHVDDVAAYVLNRLPPMYATSRRGLQNLRQRVKSEMTNQIINLIKEALSIVMQAPERALSPLPFEKFNLELEETLVQLRKILGREDITWRNVAEVVEEVLKAPRNRNHPIWKAKHDV